MMKEKVLAWAVEMFLERLEGEDMKEWIDKGLDMVEDKVASTPSKTDDMIVLPMCRIIREAFSVPDTDEPVE